MIKQKDGTFSEQAGQFCQGADDEIVNNRYCLIPMQSVLRQSPYSLEYSDLVIAKVKARNSIGWAESFSPENEVGAQIQVLPNQMQDVYEGIATDDTRIQVNWYELTEDKTGGSTILSYNLELMIGGVWTELVGQTTYYQDKSYLIQTGI